MAKTNNRIILKNVRLSYANLFEPRPADKDDPDSQLKYSTALIIPKDHPQVDDIKSIVDAIGKSRFGENWAKIKRRGNPLKDPDAEYKAERVRLEADSEDPDDAVKPDESVRGSYVLNSSSKRQPQVVDRKLQRIMDDSEIWSGCYANVSLGAFAYDKDTNKGVSFGLNNVQLVKEGERLGGAPNADEEFGAIEDDDEADFDMN